VSKQVKAAVGPQIQRREAWVKLGETFPEYEGFDFKVWVNAPTRLWDGLQAGDEATVLKSAQSLFLGHNGWIDFEGEAYAQPTEAAFWEDIPTELASCMFVVAQQAMLALPKSAAPKKRR
jgi:hypothetical protein